MRHQDRSSLPLCPGCRARHYPAVNGAGDPVWCQDSHPNLRGRPMNPGGIARDIVRAFRDPFAGVEIPDGLPFDYFPED